MRRANLKGVYEVHTNTMQYPKIMQPTHVRWEEVPLEPDAQIGLTTNMSSLNIANTDSPQSTNEPSNDNPTNESNDQLPTDSETSKPATIFPPVPRSVTDRYVVQDIIYESPQYSNMGIPGPDGDLQDIGYNGMVSIANPTHPEFMTPEIIALLPSECKESLLDAATAEVEWKSKWGTESENGQRAKPTKSYAWFP
jgi:chromatin structure-remodeling complex protein RSC7